MLFNEDCLVCMKTMPSESIDMIYLDPPFYSQKKQKLSDSSGSKYEFSDVWNTKKSYLNFMSERIVQMKRLLKNTGSIFLHCDTSANYYLRMLLDEIMGEKNFKSEIIWTYKRWSNSKKGLLNCHQTILFYSKSDEYKFNTFYGEYSPTTNLDQILQKRERNGNGKAAYKRDLNGQIIQASEKKGVPLSDVWDIPFLNPKAKERTGYPTQKPIELLERVIKISTDEGDTVLDPFCGSGTTLVGAKLLKRKYIGIDTNPKAIALCTQRLKTPAKTESVLLKTGAQSYRTKTKDEKALLNAFDCNIVQRNKGIDAFLCHYCSGSPVAVKIQKSQESFEEAVKLLDNAAKKKNCAVTILLTDEKSKSQRNVPNNMIVIYKCNSSFGCQPAERIKENEKDTIAKQPLTKDVLMDYDP